ncbi:hypothetical protein HK097_004872 [Rhizophlyctis rosea]|uniref:C2H2-type domain-containing protein n=1 Tax=Rhizophlyctis rosea TaxID=64517 RepID=A0AAD5SJB7_9FUNG|nr:hypothetical protein HK097_004872 [Rhizophlyctis rosea]
MSRYLPGNLGDRYYATYRARQQYMEDSHFPCQHCDEYFWNEDELHQHDYDYHSYNYYHSYACEYCDDEFSSQDDLDEHDNDYHSFTCERCDKVFPYEDRLSQHISAAHTTCKTCHRQFHLPKDLDNHLNSGIHDTTTQLSCPFCDATFRKASALTQHLENNTCPNQRVTRSQVKRYVQSRERKFDMRGTLVVPRIEGGPGARGRAPTPPQYATEESWNGTGYECCMCSREFRSLGNLNAHLITHEPYDYKCFVCDKRFNLLSAVIQHWELTGCGKTAANAAQRLTRLRRIRN